MRLTVYTDYVYRQRDGITYAERAFALFVIGLAGPADRLTILGRLATGGEGFRYPLPKGFDFVPLPFYESAVNLAEVLRAGRRSIAAFRRALGDSDGAWLLGPSPFAVAFAVITLLERKRLILGVRQDYPAYIRARHRSRPLVRTAALALDLAFRLLARWADVVAVGPHIASQYRNANRVLDITVSLTREDDIVPVATALGRSYTDELRVLSVGRLEQEKNPTMLADVLANLRSGGGKWKLVMCGEGPLRYALLARLRELGVEEHASLLGYVNQGEELEELYRSSHALLHVSWTEGFPQVIGEAFAAGLPVVATAVGGIESAVGDAARLIMPGEPQAAAAGLRDVAEDRGLREELITRGHAWASEHSFEAETARVRAFLEGTPEDG